MSVELKNNQFLSYLVVLLALFILILFTKDQIMNIQSNSDQVEQLNAEYTKARATQEEFKKIELEVEDKDSETQRYLIEDENGKSWFSEDEMVNYFYSYADSIQSGSWSLTIKSVHISPISENEMWFLESNISLNVEVSNEKVMKALLDYLIDQDSKYRFFIESFNYPFDGREGTFNVQLPLKIFYR